MIRACLGIVLLVWFEVAEGQVCGPPGNQDFGWSPAASDDLYVPSIRQDIVDLYKKTSVPCGTNRTIFLNNWIVCTKDQSDGTYYKLHYKGDYNDCCDRNAICSPPAPCGGPDGDCRMYTTTCAIIYKVDFQGMYSKFGTGTGDPECQI